MKTLIVILKRRLLSPAFIVLFIISVFAVPFISSLGGDTLFPPAGFFLEGDDDISLIIGKRLEKLGYSRFYKKEELLALTEKAFLDCALIVPQNIEELLRDMTPPYAKLIASSSAARYELRKAEAVSAVFSERAKFITFSSMNDAVSFEEVSDVYEKMLRDGAAFSFTTETETGTAPEHSDKPFRLALLGGSTFLMLLMFTAVLSPIASDIKNMGIRLTAKQLSAGIIIPEIICAVVIALSVSFLTSLLSGFPKLFFPFFGYCLILIIPGIMAFRFAPKATIAYMLLCCFSAPAVCPVFSDLSLAFPAIKALRTLLAPCWLWGLAL